MWHFLSELHILKFCSVIILCKSIFCATIIVELKIVFLGSVNVKSNLKIMVAMLIFGSIGVFVKSIGLSSMEIAFLRAIIGSIFLIFISFFMRQRLSVKDIKANMLLLIFSGAAIGSNWILLFQSYKYTTISNATLSYYFAPIFVILLAPFILKEKLTLVKVLSAIMAMIGLAFILNMENMSDGTYDHLKGILYGLSAAVLYASVVLMNKFMKNLTGLETTLIQLMIAGIVLLPSLIIKNSLDWTRVTYKSWVLILVLGIVHTGIAYYLYFSSIKDLKGQSIAILSYIDPISAVIIASIILGENISFMQIIGGILILGSTFMSEKYKSA